MKHTKQSVLALSAILLILSAYKKNNASPAPFPGISSLSGVWICSNWINAADTIKYTFNTSAKNALDSYLNPQTYGYKVGDVLLSNIATTATPGPFSCTAQVRSGSNNSVLSNGTIRLIL